MRVIEVYVILSKLCMVDHIHIQMEQRDGTNVLFYTINPPSRGKEKPTRLDETDNKLKNFREMRAHGEVICLKIEGDLQDIASVWHAHTQPYWDEEWGEMSERYHEIANNCADSVAWFLEKFADIPKPEFFRGPVTCNKICCFFFLPSFLQPITTPGYVYAYTQEYIKKHDVDTVHFASETSLLEKSMTNRFCPR